MTIREPRIVLCRSTLNSVGVRFRYCRIGWLHELANPYQTRLGMRSNTALWNTVLGHSIPLQSCSSSSKLKSR
jgi:hypothetical protein